MPTNDPAAARGSTARRRAGTWGVLLPLLASSAALASAPHAQARDAAADAGDGTVKVRVVREVNANGRWDQVLEPGMNQVEVRLTDDAGTTVTARTGPDGTATFTPDGTALKGGKYRVQVINPKPGVLWSAFASDEGLAGGPTYLTSTEEFVDVTGGRNTEFTTAFWNPGDYCQKNATLVTACIRKDMPAGGADPETRTLISFPYNARGNRNQTTNLSDKATTGALYGIGWNKQKKWVFSGAMARRGSSYGPGGAGGVYVTDMAGGDTTLFTTVPDAGTTAHAFATDMDLPFKAAVSTESLGDVEVSEDGKDLYVVNLNNKTLYRYDATQKTAAAPKGTYPIPDPGCAAPGDWRPGAIGIQDGDVYVGGTCSGESTQDKADMRAVVQKFDPAAGAFGDVVMDQKLDFPRQVADTIAAGCGGGSWYPWTDAWRGRQDNKVCARGGRYGYPQPFLTDVIVDTDGELILGFRDRFADQSGQGVAERDAAGVFNIEAMSGGDLNRACKGADGTYVIDGNGGCANNSTVPGIREFYPGDARTIWHPESAFGGVALSKVETTIASSGIDVDNATTFSSGTLWVNRTGGGPATGYGNVQTTTFGKGGAMADLEVLCDEAPIQIGNRVWYDVDKDGIQDPGERPVPGATVNLYDANGTLVATTVTTARGEYYFDSVRHGLKFDTQYTIKIDNPADYEQGGPLYRWVVTQNDAGTNDFIDSDGKVPPGGKFPEHTITTGKAGQDNHTYDFGYNQPDGELRVLKVDADTKKPVAGAEFQLWRETNGDDGLQADGDTPDTKVGAVQTSGADGIAKLPRQPLGTYYWQETKAPAGYDLPDPAVFGPLELDFDNFKAGAQVTAEDLPTPFGDLRVLKVDADTNAPLAGAEFQLWRETNGDDGLQADGDTPDTKVGAVQTSGADGIAKVAKQPVGTYYWQETKAPAGYELPDPAVFGPLVIDRATYKAGAQVTAADKVIPLGELRVLKVNSITKQPLGGAGFQLWRETNGEDGLQADGDTPDTKVGAAQTTGADGVAKVVKQPLGTYYWQETEAPAGHKLPDPAVFGPLVLDADTYQAGAEVTVENEPEAVPLSGGIRIIKVDARTRKPLAGAVFQLWRDTNGKPGLQRTGTGADTRVGGACTTPADGTCETINQRLGTYYWQEVKAPAGYPLPKNPVFGPYAITPQNASTIVSDTVVNTRPKVPAQFVLVKRDAKTKKPLQGAVFQLWRETNGKPGLQRTGAGRDTKVGTACATDRRGTCRYPTLPGRYYLQELAVPEGYVMPANRVFGPYGVGENTKTLSVSLYNKRGEQRKKK
ncbi:SpaA isopeptide-forming pilin-related protein [Streptomyces sp. NPDC001941]|uniref:SpaA isopeptide-forming pilin-related protein n=1 Tax=Streptomyces sp. NPDC001941 TaxID=3154659 RepID=UPI00332FA144